VARWPFSDPCREYPSSNPRFIMLTTIFSCGLTVGKACPFSSPCKQALGGAGSVDHYLYAFRGVLYVLQERAVESPARMSRPSSSRAPLSSRKIPASCVTLAFSLHCWSFKPRMRRSVHTPYMGISRTSGIHAFSMVLFFCSAFSSWTPVATQSNSPSRPRAQGKSPMLVRNDGDPELTHSPHPEDALQ